MNVFTSLRRLFPSLNFPEEDFLTEIVAAVLAEHPELTLQWLRDLGVTALRAPCRVEVETQYPCRYDDGESLRPKFLDMRIRLIAESTEEVVFVESKVGSGLSGDEQLAIYAAILAEQPGDRRTLLFITRDYSPQAEVNVFSKIADPGRRPGFRQTRWFEFARMLRSIPDKDALTLHLLHYMNEHALTRPDVFTTRDLAALSGLPHAMALLRASVDEAVKSAFREVAGPVADSYDTDVQVAREGTYRVRSASRDGVWASAGIWFADVEDAYPKVFCDVTCGKKAANRPQVIRVMAEFCRAREGIWCGVDLSESSEVAYMYREAPITEFLVGERHANRIRDYLLELIGELAEFRRECPETGWPVGS